MKAKHIWIIVGVIALVLIIVNWNKIFSSEKKRVGGPTDPATPGGTAKPKCVEVECCPLPPSTAACYTKCKNAGPCKSGYTSK